MVSPLLQLLWLQRQESHYITEVCTVDLGWVEKAIQAKFWVCEWLEHHQRLFVSSQTLFALTVKVLITFTITSGMKN